MHNQQFTVNISDVVDAIDNHMQKEHGGEHEKN